MSCTRPLKAYWRSRSRDAITFDVNKSLTKISFALPCGRCIGCRMEKARQWGLRCLKEAGCWRSSLYVTLTYNDEAMPPGGSLCVRDVQLFMKRLRKHCNKSDFSAPWTNPITSKVTRSPRFFLGGEYGEDNKRPHYHALLFNVGFGDLRKIGVNKRGEPLYTSEQLSSLWSADGVPMGFITIGAVTFDSAVYCAKYALKKLNITEDSPQEAKEAYEKRYVVYDADGIVHERLREFAVMSRCPGIGALYYEKYGHEIRTHDSMVVDGREVRPPRYFDAKSDSIDPDGFAKLKAVRKRKAVLAKPDNTPERLRVKETLMQIASDKKERSL